MSNRWTYGDYQFSINPNSQSSSYQLVGDDARTLSGAIISQPTSFMETYEIRSVLFQPRSRVVSEVSISNGVMVKYYNEKFYVLNGINDRIDIYNSNLSLISNMPLTSTTNKSYCGFDVQPDYIWVCSQDATTDYVYRFDHAGAMSGPTSLAKSKSTTGLAIISGYFWILRYDGNISKIRISDNALITTVVLSSGLYYQGMAPDNNYLIIGNNDDGLKTVFHLDTNSLNIVNSFEIDTAQTIDSVTKDKSHFYVFNKTAQKMQKIRGNTVQLDLDKLQKEILTKQFVNMVDDMGVTQRVYVSNFRSDRKLGYEQMYDISMSITKVNRG